MTEQTIIIGESEALPGNLVGALLGFMQHLAMAETPGAVFDAFAGFAREERIGDLLLEVDTDGAVGRWTAIEPVRVQCYDRSGTAGRLRTHLAERRLPNVVLWGLSDLPGADRADAYRPDAYRIDDASALGPLRVGGIAGGLFAAMQLPSGRKASAQILADVGQFAALPNLASDLFLVAAIQAFLVLDRCLGPVPPKGLTRRELEALRLSARGLSLRAVAETMQISEATVKFHLGGARRKTNASNTREAIAILSSGS